MSEPKPSAKSIFLSAVEIDSLKKREAFVQSRCGHDPVLLAEVERLLANQPNGSYLESPPADLGMVVTVDQLQESSRRGEKSGIQIGPYKIREQIGEGGMGSVFVAEQERPLRRKVALKLIKPGMDSKVVLGRFEAERNVLALMNHPNIANVLDAGTTDAGHPFFVMELVNGIPITEYCDDQKLPICERLRLFVDVCCAIQHAHQKGIIHRDIKPSNVLVTELDGKPIAKVIDFGVAKALNQSLSEHSVYTAFQTVIGTPLYMSPEQASFSAVDVDTRSDVYSLGVLLYELLTGTTPFTSDDLKQAAQEEVFKFIREQEPPRPSNRISSLGQTATKISQLRRTQPEQLGRSVKGDLDWIVMKALSKERGRRYDSATRFAEDVTRHLSSEIVEARPPTFGYQMSKLVARNRQLAIGVLLGFVMLTGGLGFWLRSSLQLAREKRKLEVTLTSLGDSSMRLALNHALVGNREGMEDALQAADRANVSAHRRKLIALCFDLYAGGDQNYQRVVDELKSLVEQADRPRERIAAQALLANAAIWNGSYLDLHYQLLSSLKEELPPIFAGTQELDLEGAVFLGQTFGPVSPHVGLQLLEPAYIEMNSPAIRLLIAQAKLELARDSRDSAVTDEALQHANASYAYLPESSMAAALRIIALHEAWRVNLDNIKPWYVEEAWTMVNDFPVDSVHPGRIFAADFLAEADLPRSMPLFWEMLRSGRVMPNVPGYLILNSPERYEEILEILESRTHNDLAWGGVPNSVLMLKAMNAQKHDELRIQLLNIDENQQRIIGTDPRFFGLLAALIMEGKAGENAQRLAASFLRRPPIQEIYFATGAAEYVLGSIEESKFIELNQLSPRQLSLAETIVAFARIGERDRTEAIRHLHNALNTSAYSSIRGFVCALHKMLTENEDIVDWVRPRIEPSQQ